MQFSYDSPLGELKLDVTLGGVCTLRFPTDDAKRLAHNESVTQFVLMHEQHFLVGTSDIAPYIDDAKRWLDLYFEGKNPDFMPDTMLLGSEVQKKVWELLKEIPYGKSTTYGELAKKYKERYHIEKMSAQAIGQAVGANQLPIIIPCHRVLASKSKISGFADGVARKAYLLGIEQIPWRP